MKELSKLFTRLIKDEEGATAVEYGVLVALIIAACVVIIGAVGVKVNAAFSLINDELP